MESVCSNCNETFTQEPEGKTFKQCPICRGLMREYSRRRAQGNPRAHSLRNRYYRLKARPDLLDPTPKRWPKLPTGPEHIKEFRTLFCEDDSRGRIWVQDFYQRYTAWCITKSITPYKRSDAMEIFIGHQYGLATGTGQRRGQYVAGLRWKGDHDD